MTDNPQDEPLSRPVNQSHIPKITNQESEVYVGTFYHVFVGYLDDPKFSWDGGNWNGNIPSRRYPALLTGRWSDRETCFELIRRIETRFYDGRQTDWSGWVARLSKDQIIAYIREMEGNADFDNDPDVKAFIDSLNPNKKYALVGCESPFAGTP
jgi:hypothetical protein